jgi:hypothetical protein
LVFLNPELGDDVASYDAQPTINPVTGARGLALKHKPGGGCIYLAEGVGCTIHGRAPALCRQFDCRRFFLVTTRSDRRRLIAEGLFSEDVLDAGRSRLNTLDQVAAVV